MTSRKSKSRSVKMRRISDYELHMLNATAQIAVALIEAIASGRLHQVSPQTIVGVANNYLVLYQKTLDGISTINSNQTIN